MSKIPKMIMVDLDDTAFGADRNTIPPRTEALLRQYIARGTLLVPSTGRSPALVPLEAFPKLEYVVCSNGAYIQNVVTGEVLRTVYLPRERVQEVWAAVRSLVRENDIPMELFVDDQLAFEEKVYADLDAYEPKLPLFHMKYARSGQGLSVACFDDYIANEADHVIKMNFPGKCAVHYPALGEALYRVTSVEAASDGSNLECTRKGCTKGDALLWLADYLGFDREDVVAFGNGKNDIPMLQAAGYGVAMGNSGEDVKAAADYVTATNLEDGIAVFLEKMFPLTED